MIIETARLIIRPLTYDQIIKYIASDNSLETELQVGPSTRTISPDLKEAFEHTILPNVADPSKNYLYSTLWTIIAKEENKMVGDLCFVGEPNGAGEIEIGYGTYDEFQKKGFMTEAVSAMIKWAAEQPHVNAVLANTEKTNPASFAVLQKNGFVKYDEDETLYKWKISVK